MLSDIRTTQGIKKIFLQSWAGKNTHTFLFTKKEAKTLLSILCIIYNLPALKEIDINKTNCDGANAVFNRSSKSIYFSSESDITPLNIFHEFAHYLDFTRYQVIRKTVDTSNKCNGKATQWFYEYNSMLYEKTKDYEKH